MAVEFSCSLSALKKREKSEVPMFVLASGIFDREDPEVC